MFNICQKIKFKLDNGSELEGVINMIDAYKPPEYVYHVQVDAEKVYKVKPHQIIGLVDETKEVKKDAKTQSSSKK